MEINIGEMVPDTYLEKLGMTREQFKNSNVCFLLEAMLLTSIETVQDITIKLMKENGLSYGEAQTLAIDMTRQTIEKMV